MIKGKSPDTGAMQGAQSAQGAPGGFVPASYHSSRKEAKKGAEPIVNGTAVQYARTSGHYQNRPRGMSRGAKVAIGVLVAAVLVAAVAAGLFLYKEMQKRAINETMHGTLTKEEIQAVDAELTGTTSFDEPFTVLLLGSDARADDPDMGARTDTIIIVRVDPNENIVSMVSIPRDTKITLDGVGDAKFNAAYTYGGPSGTISAVKELCGVDIDHYAQVNFEGLVGLIDAIGGIDVTVDEAIDDPDAGGSVKAGKQHLDGEHALILARSRAYVDGDYTRQVNQRKVIMAIIDKALTAPATELSGLIKASTEFLVTDSGIDFDFLYSLADQIRHNNEKEIRIYSATLPSSTATINEVSYVIADTAGIKEMMKLFLAGKDVSKGVSDSSITEDIANAGGGIDADAVGTVEAVPTGDYPQIVDEDSNGYVEDQAQTYYYYEEAPAPAEDAATVDDGGGGQEATYDEYGNDV